MKDIDAKLILDILSLTSQGKKLKIFTSLPLTHQEERTGCWSIQYTGVLRSFYKMYFSLHIRAALPANETRRFFIDHRPLKKKKSCVDGVETRIGLTVERAAGNLETRSRIQDRRGLRIRSQWISKIADRNQWGLRMKSQWTSRIERIGIGEDWGLLLHWNQGSMRIEDCWLHTWMKLHPGADSSLEGLSVIIALDWHFLLLQLWLNENGLTDGGLKLVFTKHKSAPFCRQGRAISKYVLLSEWFWVYQRFFVFPKYLTELWVISYGWHCRM